MKSFAIFLLLSLASGLFAQRNEVVSLVYHRFGDDRYPSTNISLSTFEKHLKYLKEEGFESVTFSQGIKMITSDAVKGKTVAITIDDGYLSFFENGLPLLKRYGFTATLFVNTSTIGGNDFMDWEQIKKAQIEGIEIGNHSNTHPYFLDVSERTSESFFRQEIESSQAQMTQALGQAPIVFAYPYGEVNEEMKPILKEMGFIGAAAQNSGVIHAGSDLFQCPRFPMSESFGTLTQFKEKVEMRGLEVIKAEAISTGYNGSIDKPRINLEFKEEGLFVESMQCFVQGSECLKSVQIYRDGLVKMAIRPKTALSSRRTLFTITIPDNDGNWHWYSYLWVIPNTGND
ncbi:MAG: polysaccharide deacetylase [Cytophagales bacterium CG12_big_fil_rev_8_21_14_0_65_40_12]|nr:MAG: polysaccharide deacetylase [Cytophagales bacterium CG12_big_fil_rev_8_21_14_0_65_40_12]PIW03273.1 MAG: polysaccharide deacetylase [Cytophagales bacterium CG17_big_fil_post_rev_8_21_14_2_50_40_13]